MSGERFEVRGSDADEVAKAVREYIQDGLDHDSGVVAYDVVATAADGSEMLLDGEIDMLDDDGEDLDEDEIESLPD